MTGYIISILKLFCFSTGPKELSHPAVVIRIPLLTQWNGTRITCVTNARKLITVVRLVATRSWAGNRSTLLNWCAAVVATWQEHRCVRSTEQTSSSINADIAVRWRYSSASEPHISANPATMTFSVSPLSRRVSCLCVLLVQKTRFVDSHNGNHFPKNNA